MAVAKDRADALFVDNTVVNNNHTRLISEFAARLRLPTFLNFRVSPEAGGLMSYGRTGPMIGRGGRSQAMEMIEPRRIICCATHAWYHQPRRMLAGQSIHDGRPSEGA